jgi:Fur family transcriptional regulator, ferric uptake regulator
MAKTGVSPSPVDEVLTLLRAQGGHVTSPRRLLLEAIFEANGHRTAEELAEDVRAKAPDVHISTIYRNLERLEELGVIIHAHLGHGPAMYHLSAAAHGHLVCEVCGATFEASEDLFGGLSDLAKSRFGFRVDPHHFAILGRCKGCQ